MSDQQDNIIIYDPRQDIDNLPIVSPSELEEDKIVDIFDIFEPQEIRTDSLSVGDYCDITIIVHDFVIFPIEVTEKNVSKEVDMLLMSVTIPDAQEYGLMSTTAWAAVRAFKFIQKSGKFVPNIALQFEAVDTKFNQKTYRIKEHSNS